MRQDLFYAFAALECESAWGQELKSQEEVNTWAGKLGLQKTPTLHHKQKLIKNNDTGMIHKTKKKQTATHTKEAKMLDYRLAQRMTTNRIKTHRCKRTVSGPILVWCEEEVMTDKCRLRYEANACSSNMRWGKMPNECRDEITEPESVRTGCWMPQEIMTWECGQRKPCRAKFGSSPTQRHSQPS